MSDFGEFTPASAVGPQRMADGATSLGRLTTTDEQRHEAVAWITEQLGGTPVGDVEGRALVHWSRLDPSILIVTAHHETLLGKRVWVTDKVEEQLPNGAEIHNTEQARFSRLETEVGELHERGLL